MISELEPAIGPKLSLTENVAAVDYESRYDKKAGYSLSCMSYWAYNHHPMFNAYLVSIVTKEWEWVGDPKDAPWEKIRHFVWVSHNRPSDWNTHKANQEKGIVPDWNPPYWGNSANLCAFIRSPRALAKAMAILYREKRSKKIRDVDMDGMIWAEQTPEKQEEFKAYALQDGRDCLKIWLDHIHLWPEKERRISDLIDERGLRGVYIDRPGLEKDISLLKKVIFNAEQKIPWRETEKILSPKACSAECRRLGIDAPPSFDMKDAGLQAWEDQYSDTHTFVGAMRDWRRMNSILMKYEIIRDRIKPDGRAEFSIRYLGTSTGRLAAGEKGDYEDRRTFNLLNLPRSPFYIRTDLSVAYRKKEIKAIEAGIKKNKMLPEGITHTIDLRAKIIPAPGFKFGICDMSQIEARITVWLARVKPVLELIRKGFSVYDVHAIQTMDYKPNAGSGGLKEEDPGKYALAKARVLALGFQAGHVKFIIMAPMYISEEECEAIFSAPVTDAQIKWYLDGLRRTHQDKLFNEYARLSEKDKIARVNSQIIVQDFRAKNKEIVALWDKMGDELKRSVGGDYQVELPSGRVLHFFDVTSEGAGGIKARDERGGAFRYYYGGKVMQNSVQATARDVFVEGQLKLDDAGIMVVLDIYDENLTEVPLDFDVQRIKAIMTENPEWAKTLPLGAEVKEKLCYVK